MCFGLSFSASSSITRIKGFSRHDVGYDSYLDFDSRNRGCLRNRMDGKKMNEITQERVIDWFEVDEDGYPTDESLKRLGETRFDPPYAAQFLYDEFEKIVNQIPCASIWFVEGKDILDHPNTLINFTTGGWSGAESLIGTLLNNFWIKHYHSMWKRGGLYVFDIPASARISSAKKS
jgi:hypothetical protein